MSDPLPPLWERVDHVSVAAHSTMAVSTILFEDIFDVKDIDHGGKKFERGLCFS